MEKSLEGFGGVTSAPVGQPAREREQSGKGLQPGERFLALYFTDARGRYKVLGLPNRNKRETGRGPDYYLYVVQDGEWVRVGEAYENTKQ